MKINNHSIIVVNVQPNFFEIKTISSCLENKTIQGVTLYVCIVCKELEYLLNSSRKVFASNKEEKNAKIKRGVKRFMHFTAYIIFSYI